MEHLLVTGGFQTALMLMEALNKKYYVSCMPKFNSQGNLSEVIHITQELRQQT
jgi:hypothetical protein